MKKLVSFALVLVMLLSFSVAFAEVNLSELSYDELLILQKNLIKEIMSRPEWKEVSVPIGQWKVGVDIPAGTYSIKTNERSCLVCVWRNAVDDYSNGGLYYNEVISGDKPCGKIQLLDGMTITVNNPVIITPPTSLGF